MQLIRLTGIFVLAVGVVHGQKPAALSGEQILKKIEENFSRIQDYTVTLHVRVDLERLKVPDMKATMYFKQPDKMHFESEGFALLPKEGLGFTAGSLSARFDAEEVREENRLLLVPLKRKHAKTGVRPILLTVNPATWTVEQVTTSLRDGRVMTAVFEHQELEGYRLPRALTVTFSYDSTEVDSSDLFSQLPQNQRSPQIPRQGTIQIKYSDYSVNTGLSDTLFTKESAVK
jgi:outer membrane lipoprotein-sorting protein